MIEDKLTHDERLRLECLNQSIQRGSRMTTSPELIIQEAKEFEKYVLGEQNVKEAD